MPVNSVLVSSRATIGRIAINKSETATNQGFKNIVIKDFCTKNNLNFLLSATEYSMKNSSYILSELITDLDKLHGIVAYSVFQMPEEKKKKKKYLKKILKKKKKILKILN